MSYVKTFMRTQRPVATSGLTEWLQKGADILKTAGTVLNDPALPQVVGMVAELHSMEPPSKPGGAPGPGIGLNTIVKPLQAFVFYRKNTWVLPVAVAGLIGLPFFLGYTFGRSRKAT